MFSVSHLAPTKASFSQRASGGSATRSMLPSSPRDAPSDEITPSNAILGRSSTARVGSS